MAATQKVMEQLLDGNGEALHLSGELVIAKNKGETFAQHAADTTRHLTTAQVDTVIETALAPIQEELDQIASSGTGGGGDSLKVGDILLTANPKRDVSSFLPADGSRIRAEPYPDLGQVLGTEFVLEDAPTTISFSSCGSDNSDLGLNYHKLSCSKSHFVASLRTSSYSTNITTYMVSSTGKAYSWTKKTAPEAYTDICYLNNEWICACKSKLYRTSRADSSWSKKCDFPWTVSSTAGFLYNLGYGDGIYFCVPTYSGKVYISTDEMKTWTPKSADGIGNPLYSAYHDGYYMFFTAGSSTNGKMYYSKDKGETWTIEELPLPVDTRYNSMSTFELGGKFYLLGMGTVAISTDLPNWEAHPVEVTTGSTTTTYTGPVFYAEGVFIAASNISGSAYAVSADGLKWTPATVTRPISPPSGGVRYSLSVIRAALGKGDGTIVVSSTHDTIQGSQYTSRATVYCAQPTIEKKYYLTLPNVTCPGAKAYVKAL